MRSSRAGMSYGCAVPCSSGCRTSRRRTRPQRGRSRRDDDLRRGEDRSGQDNLAGYPDPADLVRGRPGRPPASPRRLHSGPGRGECGTHRPCRHGRAAGDGKPDGGRALGAGPGGTGGAGVRSGRQNRVDRTRRPDGGPERCGTQHAYTSTKRRRGASEGQVTVTGPSGPVGAAASASVPLRGLRGDARVDAGRVPAAPG